ncbi:MAG: tetratricopeptide repeat protein [Candidatus Brocadia sp.]|nr:tetratricopeptide repeat protein [Candidatus Brocadia sp.]
MIAVLKSIPFFPLLALVIQGLFFSLHASGEINGKKSSIGIWEKPRYEQAKQYIENGVIDRAIPELEKIAGLYPDNVEVHAYLGWAYSQKGLIPDSVEEFQKVLQLNPNLQKETFDYPMVKDVPAVVKEFTTNFEDLIVWIDGFSGAHEVLGSCYVQLGRLRDALNEYKKVLNLKYGHGKKDLAVDGEEIISVIDQAINEYEEVLRLKPDCVEAYIKLACAHAGKGMLDISITDMKKAIALEPDRIDAHVYLGCFYAMKWMMDEALNELGEAKKVRDCIFENLITEGERCINDGVFDNTIAVARDAIKVYPGNKKAYWLLATAYGKKGEMDKAIEICREIVRMYPDDVHAYVFLGWIYVQCDLTEEAKDLVEGAIRREPGNAEIRALMAFLYASQDLVNEAIAVCNMIIESAENNDMIESYGWIKGRVPSIEQKFREVTDILEIKSDYTEAYVCLGWLHSKNGEHEKATAAFKKAVELTPNSYNAHRYLGNLYVQSGKIKEALDEYNKALNILSGVALQQ